MTRTLKLPLMGNIKKHKLQETLAIASEIYNKHADYGFSHTNWSKKDMHKQLYARIRKEYPSFPSALIQTVRDNSCESLKSLYKNKKWYSKPNKKKYSSLRYDKRTCTLNLESNEVTMSWIDKGRLKAQIVMPEYYEKYISWDIRSIQLVYKKQLKKFFLHVSVQTESPEIKPGAVLALDKGINNFIYASNGDFIDGNMLLSKRLYYLKIREELQRLSTRSAIRKLRKISGREKGFALNYIHCIVNLLLSQPYAVYVIEDLTHIRAQRKKSKQFNYKLSNWVYNQFDRILTYKAEQLGKKVVKVDPRYTSQQCSKCGYTARANRQNQNFKCKACGFKAHADYNASLNILEKYTNGCSQSAQQLCQHN